MDIASILDNTAVGSAFTLSPQKQNVSLQDFQSVVREVRRLQKEGFVSVVKEHSESSSGHDYVDLLIAEKLRSL
ncbi:hypothetical protein [Pseudomonas asplenii]|uniref:hypothetical protein n=1 Tax=Pseudomonas asplenii TaxID=53407 RepID=UPI0006B4E571|nr:hypothetical protein [Pseudomonas fuscovaginae]